MDKAPNAVSPTPGATIPANTVAPPAPTHKSPVVKVGKMHPASRGMDMKQHPSFKDSSAKLAKAKSAHAVDSNNYVAIAAKHGDAHPETHAAKKSMGVSAANLSTAQNWHAGVVNNLSGMGFVG